MIRSSAPSSQLRPFFLAILAGLTSLLLGAGSAHLSPVASVLFAPLCGLAILIGIATDNVRTGKVDHASLALAASAAIICGPLGAIVTMIVR